MVILRNYQEFFKEHTMAYLNGAFVNKQRIGLEKYKHIMENKLLVELNSSLQYNKLQNFYVV
jgi:hypothetical protein